MAGKLKTCATTRAGIAFGSNLGDRLAQLKAARQRLSALAGIEPPLLASAVYETEPVNCEPDAPAFLNAVVEIGYSRAPLELLQELRDIEAALGRPAAHVRNVSRTLDLDLLYFGDLEMARPELQLPHPRMHERRFVLEPLSDIRADLILPRQELNVATLLQQLPPAQRLVRVTSEW
ncbi:MAG: 2-amino-4-hydroxy-6-hydroxymethyldihydropteridine diphosphokinase [Chthoniobacterales bacterium]